MRIKKTDMDLEYNPVCKNLKLGFIGKSNMSEEQKKEISKYLIDCRTDFLEQEFPDTKFEVDYDNQSINFIE